MILTLLEMCGWLTIESYEMFDYQQHDIGMSCYNRNYDEVYFNYTFYDGDLTGESVWNVDFYFYF